RRFSHIFDVLFGRRFDQEERQCPGLGIGALGIGAKRPVRGNKLSNSVSLAAAFSIGAPIMKSATIDSVGLIWIGPRLPHAAGLEHRSQPFDQPPRRTVEGGAYSRVERRLIRRLVNGRFGVRCSVAAPDAWTCGVD